MLHPYALYPGAIQGKKGIKFCHLATLPAAVAVEEPLLGQDGAPHDGADARLHVLVRYLRPGGDRARGSHLQPRIEGR